MSNKSGISDQVLSLPTGGGALQGIGEKFQPDLHTGTGNFTVPLALPPGRNGLQPSLSLSYSTGNGNGPFGLGWGLPLPEIRRNTSRGVPEYGGDDVFVLTGSEDLVPVEQLTPGVTRFRPRTEGLFALIDRHQGEVDDYWRVQTRDGLVSTYGTPGAKGRDPGALANPSVSDRVFAWKVTQTEDPFGNLIVYEYDLDTGAGEEMSGAGLYLRAIRYADYQDAAGQRAYLASVRLEYEDRPDAFGEFRAGFPVRWRRRCREIATATHAGRDRPVRRYVFAYGSSGLNNVSLLEQLIVMGCDDQGAALQELPPLDFRYTTFRPDDRQSRNFFPMTGPDLPAVSLAHPDFELADLFADGLPSLVEMNGVARRWRNLGSGRFDRPQVMQASPAGLKLADRGVQLMDADGDGRIDLVVSQAGLSGHFPLDRDGEWSRERFHPYTTAPTFAFDDPEVQLIDLNGDGVTDVIRAGARFECFFNDPDGGGWTRTRVFNRRSASEFPDVTFSDPRVKWADMSGDGLQDIVLVHDGSVEYWPNLGHGHWAARLSMAHSPRLPDRYDPKRILLGDLDGDGLADLIYVDDGRVTLWINQSGIRWSDPIVITGTPRVGDTDGIRIADMLGTGVSGVLWSTDTWMGAAPSMHFLDLTGAIKPYLLVEMTNNIGATTRVEYRPSTHFYVEDQARPETRWTTSLPFPVQVVSRVEVIDAVSGGKLTNEFRYHDGHWDGVEREFRGFGLVEQLDSETFDRYHESGLHPGADFGSVETTAFAPPVLTKTWFHQGILEDERLAPVLKTQWHGDPSWLSGAVEEAAFVHGLGDARARREAVRTLRGNAVRTERYALDESAAASRPHTVTERTYRLRRERTAGGGRRADAAWFAHLTAERTTEWERGDDPLTRVSFLDDYDAFGHARRLTNIACPRGWRDAADVPAGAFLSTRTRTSYATPSAARFVADRVSRKTQWAIQPATGDHVFSLRDTTDESPRLKVIAETINFYDGPAFVGLALGQIGAYGALVRSEVLTAMRDSFLTVPAYLEAGVTVWATEYPTGFRDALPVGAGFQYRLTATDTVGGWYTLGVAREYDFHSGAGSHGLVTAELDALRNQSTRIYDRPYHLFATQIRDAAGLTLEAVYDYRVMKPREVVDANGTRSRVTFSPLGLVTSSAMQGAAGIGDAQHPGTVLQYDLLAFHREGLPIAVRTTQRVHHDTDTDVLPAQRDGTVRSIEYSDGFGRLTQVRAETAPEQFGDVALGEGDTILPLRQASGSGPSLLTGSMSNPAEARVVVSGWTRFNNKGNAVERYEPFFSTGWDYRHAGSAPLGSRVRMFYDALGRLIRTVNADGSTHTVIHGIPRSAEPDDVTATPWESYSYDENDNAGRTHPQAVEYRHHWNTPSSAVVDALGRTIATTERTRPAAATATAPLPSVEEFRSVSVYDIRGNLIQALDPLGRVTATMRYDLAGRKVYSATLDGGAHHTVYDAAGHVIESRDSRGALTLRSYDALGRVASIWARETAAALPTLRERYIYGDAAASGLSRTVAASAGLLNRLYQQFDGAGVLTFSYDFKGGIAEKTRQVIADSAIQARFQAPPPDWDIGPLTVDWAAGPALDPQQYVVSYTSDALGRVRRIRYPEDTAGVRHVVEPEYTPDGALQRLRFDGDLTIEHVAYNARGQRTLLVYGPARAAANGVIRRFAYDPTTFRLGRVRTDSYRSVAGQSLTFQIRSSSQPLQDLQYDFDTAGNLLTITDRTLGCGVLNHADATAAAADAALIASGDEFIRRFAYDPLYRLVAATGREGRLVPSPRSRTDEPWNGFNGSGHGTPTQDNAPSLAVSYRESYEYDPAGNLIGLHHAATNNPWARTFGVGGLSAGDWSTAWRGHIQAAAVWAGAPSNAVTHASDGTPTTMPTFTYDANGRLVREDGARHFDWDHLGRLHRFRVQAGPSEPTVHVDYSSDAAGERILKTVRRQGGAWEFTVYIDGLFEHRRWAEAGTQKSATDVHVLDHGHRIVTAHYGDRPAGDQRPAVQYQIDDHVTSSVLVVDRDANWVNREEYFPFGETSFGSFAYKRYRFGGRERDQETGLYHHVARYYLPWAAKWISPDPSGAVDSANLYEFVRNNPLRLIDPSGRGGTKAPPLIPPVATPAVGPKPAPSAPAPATPTPASTTGTPPPAEPTLPGPQKSGPPVIRTPARIVGFQPGGHPGVRVPEAAPPGWGHRVQGFQKGGHSGFYEYRTMPEDFCRVPPPGADPGGRIPAGDPASGPVRVVGVQPGGHPGTRVVSPPPPVAPPAPGEFEVAGFTRPLPPTIVGTPLPAPEAPPPAAPKGSAVGAGAKVAGGVLLSGLLNPTGAYGTGDVIDPHLLEGGWNGLTSLVAEGYHYLGGDLYFVNKKGESVVRKGEPFWRSDPPVENTGDAGPPP